MFQELFCAMLVFSGVQENLKPIFILVFFYIIKSNNLQ